MKNGLREIDTFLFDLDGTLIDSAKDIAEAVNYALRQLGLSELPEEEIIKHVGYGARNLMKDVLQTEDEELIEKATKLFTEYYFQHPVVYTKPYPYIPETLEILKAKNKKIGVITNKRASLSKEILEKLDLLKYIDIVIGPETTGEKKPSPKPVLYALQNLKSNPDEAILIGDSEVDIQAGKSAGTKTGLVKYGYGKIHLALAENPDIIFETPEDLYKFAKEI
jgi:phosphoglycolate phosphatase